MRSPWFWLLVKGMIWLTAAYDNRTANVAAQLRKLIAENYDSKVRPHADGPPVNVTVQVSIVALGPINEKTLTYDIDIFLRHFWNDPRIKLNTSKSLTFNGNPGEFLWIPDTYMPNARSVRTYKALTENTRATVSPNGDIYVSSRMLATCACKMNLRKYPMDSQQCKLLLESYSYSGADIMYYWIKNEVPVEIVDGGLQVSGYEVTGIQTKAVMRTYTIAEKFPLLEMSITIKRTFSYFLYRAYLPSSLLVFLTWGTFWVPSTAIPARVTMIVTNFLSTIFILNNAGSQITRVPYNTAMEVYLSTNTLFIILVLLEYLLVLNINRRKYVKRLTPVDHGESESYQLTNRNKIKKSHLLETTDIKVISYQGKLGMKDKILSVLLARPIDSTAKIVFPFTYILFLFVYFVYYSMI